MHDKNQKQSFTKKQFVVLHIAVIYVCGQLTPNRFNISFSVAYVLKRVM